MMKLMGLLVLCAAAAAAPVSTVDDAVNSVTGDALVGQVDEVLASSMSTLAPLGILKRDGFTADAKVDLIIKLIQLLSTSLKGDIKAGALTSRGVDADAALHELAAETEELLKVKVDGDVKASILDSRGIDLNAIYELTAEVPDLAKVKSQGDAKIGALDERGLDSTTIFDSGINLGELGHVKADGLIKANALDERGDAIVLDLDADVKIAARDDSDLVADVVAKVDLD